jgi:hypothetical protein
MAQRLTTAFINTVTPGAYPHVTVQSVPSGVGNTGVIAIIGEAAGGADFSEEDLKNNHFTPDQADRVLAKYVSGPIVDAMNLLASPSADALITGSVTSVFILKTNAGAKALAVVDTDYGSLRAKNWGSEGNKIKYKIVASQLEVAPEKEGAAVPAFGATLNSKTFSVRLNGGAAAAVTLSATAGDHNNIANLIIELNTLLPAGIVASAGTITDSFKLTMAADSANYRKGWGKSFELVETTPTHLAALGHVAGLTVSSAESEVEASVIRTDIGANETLEAKGEIALELGYQGTTATVSIAAGVLSTTVVGGSGASIASLALSQFATLADLADYLNSQTGYSASVPAASQQTSPMKLDEVAAVSMASSAASLRPGRIKKSQANWSEAVAESAIVEWVEDDTDGLPSPMASYVFLAGGDKGATSSANVVDALAALEAVKCNFFIPLMSRDASDDIAEGLTDSASTYTIDAIHAAAKNHELKMSTPKLKRNRSSVLSFWGSYADSKEKAQAQAHYRSSMAFQKVRQIDSQGVVQEYLPWAGACVAAGMQAAGFYKGITNKLANVISFIDPSGFDAGNPGDVEDALLAGLLILQDDTAGVKWVSDQTTYGLDSNFVYNSMQAVYLADVVALDLTDALQRAFVGQSLADVDAATALAFIQTKMEEYRRIKAITPDDEAPLGYRNAKVKITGPVMEVSLEIKLSTTIYFIPIELSISQVQSSAA